MSLLLDKNLETRKNQALVQSRYKLKPLALKLITTLISLIQSEDTPEQEYCISVKDFKDLAKLKGKDYYKKLQSACIDIMDNSIYIPQNNEDFLVVNWASSCKYIKNDSLIKFKISSELFPYIINLKKGNFLKYDLKNILMLKSDYSIRMYELLKDEFNKNKRYSKKAEVVLELDFLKSRLKIPKSYTYQHIKERILDKSATDLFKSTDIKIDWEVASRLGKGVKSIRFKIYPNMKNIQEHLKLPTYLDKFMSYVNYLRGKYAGTTKCYFVSNSKLFNKRQIYFYGISNKDLVFTMPDSGGEALFLTKTEAEISLNASYLCAKHSQFYRDFISNEDDFWDISRDAEQSEYYNLLQIEMSTVLEEFSPKDNPFVT